MKRKSTPALAEDFVWPRSDKAALAAFNPATKQCTMNCGQARADPRDHKEMMFQCGDCFDVPVQPTEREKFERWASTNLLGTPIDGFAFNAAWAAWQARATL